MDLFTITVAVVSGAAVGAGLARAACRCSLNDRKAEMLRIHRICQDTAKTLQALRRNCFVRNAAGNRVRYTNATAEERAKAEGQV